MAEGMICPKCKSPMFAQEENPSSSFRYDCVIDYVCRDNNCKHSLSKEEKISEDFKKFSFRKTNKSNLRGFALDKYWNDFVNDFN